MSASAITPAPTRTALAVPESFKAPNVHWTTSRVATVGNFLEDLRQTTGKLTTDIVVAAARQAGSPLRDFFEWKQGKAAHQWNRMQARMLMRRLHVQAPGKDGGVMRAYVAVQIKGEPYQHSMYIPLTAALQTEHYREEIIGRMRARAKAYGANLSAMQHYRRSL